MFCNMQRFWNSLALFVDWSVNFFFFSKYNDNHIPTTSGDLFPSRREWFGSEPTNEESHPPHPTSVCILKYFLSTCKTLHSFNQREGGRHVSRKEWVMWKQGSSSAEAQSSLICLICLIVCVSVCVCGAIVCVLASFSVPSFSKSPSLPPSLPPPPPATEVIPIPPSPPSATEAIPISPTPPFALSFAVLQCTENLVEPVSLEVHLVCLWVDFQFWNYGELD